MSVTQEHVTKSIIVKLRVSESEIVRAWASWRR